jgi:hypothetical protein
MCYWACALTSFGDLDGALKLLGEAVENGLASIAALELPPFEVLRADSRFTDLLAQVRTRQDAAIRAFADAGGPRLLGLSA